MLHISDMTSTGNQFLSPLAPFAALSNDKKDGHTMTNIQELASPPIETDGSFPEASYPTKENATDSDIHKYLSPFISERAINQPRPLKVIYIGAGISGIWRLSSSDRLSHHWN
jgi:hypothetical protein